MASTAPPRLEALSELRWWERRSALAALACMALVPLLWPDVPPLLDLPGHMGRYAVQLESEGSGPLRDYFSFEWRLIGNLGVDLLVVPLAKIFGLELAVKLIVMTIPLLTVAGLLWVAREVHGRVPPTALFALPFAYNFPFLFGFVNFALSMALALLTLALWLRMARLGRTRLRALVMVPLSLLLWVCHAFGWGVLGVLAFSAEFVRQKDKGLGLFAAALRAALHAASLAAPMLLMILWRSDAGAATGDWLNWAAKLDWLLMGLRDRWELFDRLSLLLCLCLILFAILSPRLRVSRSLGTAALLLLALFMALPQILFGSAYADMRLAPFLFAIALIAIRLPAGSDRRLGPAIAAAGLAFLLLRTGATTASIALYDRSFDRELEALAHVPRGARLVAFVGRDCREPWAMSRLLHLPSMAIVRRHAFSNDQWTMAGAQLLGVRYSDGWPFMRDPSQMVTARRCAGEQWMTQDEAMRRMPRGAFDYLWMIDPPFPAPGVSGDLRPVWRSGRSVLYRLGQGE